MNKYLLTLLLAIHFCNNTFAQDCNSAILPSTPESRFTVNGDGTVTDHNTALEWMRCSVGQTWDGSNCTGSAVVYDWQQALSSAESQNFANNDDWRLPNIKELNSILEQSCAYPAINERIFPNTPGSYFWSSSTGRYENVWYVNFYYGYDSFDDKYKVRYVRLVRGSSEKERTPLN